MRKHLNHYRGSKSSKPAKAKRDANPSSERGAPAPIDNPLFDSRLESEVEWHIKVLDYLLPKQDHPVDAHILFCAICEALMSIGLVEWEVTAAGTLIKLKPHYRRTASIIVVLFSVAEVILQCHKEGLGPDKCIDKAIDMQN